MRIALSGPGDIDEEVLGWLRQAYDLSMAPPAPGLAEHALHPGRRLVARVRLTDARGNPGCADLGWSVERAP